MNNTIQKLLVLSSGGDAPGMNAGIRAVVRSAIYHGLEVYGTEMGYRGLIQRKLFKLEPNSVANCIQRGGTILKTDRCIEFKEKSVRDGCRIFLQEQGIDAMVVLGGDGSFRGASLLNEEGGPPVIGIPCTIDNDIVGTDYCIGFDTARNTALEAIDKIRDTASSLDRNFIIEVMGRDAGFLAFDVGIAGGAEIILLPEFPITAQELVTKIQKGRRQKLTSIIVASEAGDPGRSVALAQEIKELSGIEYRVCILGHTQRGGTPSTQDRKMGSIMGAKAVSALMHGETKKMTAMQCGKLTLSSFPRLKDGSRRFNDEQLLHLNEIICDI